MYYLAKKNDDGTLKTKNGYVLWMHSNFRDCTGDVSEAAIMMNAVSDFYQRNFIPFFTWKVLNVIQFRQVKVDTLLGFENCPEVVKGTESIIPKPEIQVTQYQCTKVLVRVGGMETKMRNNLWFYKWRLDRAVDKLIKRYYIKAFAELAYS